jgi:putative Flp pilus-assembly TadE/G-like protein
VRPRRAEDPRCLLAHDERGAILVMGIVMAVLLVGVLYYLEGVGESLFHRERLQDAADAAALSTAIGHARGMNLIVFINLIMAALVAVLLALKVIEMLLSALLVILAAIAWFVPAAGAQIPIVNGERTIAKQTHEAARKVVEPLLGVLHTTERVVAAVVPSAAMVRTALDVQGEYADVVGDVPPPTLPTRLTLPVDNDRYEVLCERAEGLLAGLVSSATNRVPFIGKVIGLALNGIIAQVADYYCRGAEAPKAELEFDRTLPQSPAGRRCEDAQLALSADLSACAEWQRELALRRPDATSGDCPDPNGPCEDNLWLARRTCDPANERLQSFSFARAHVVESLTYTAAGWTTTSYRYERLEHVNYPAGPSATPPAGAAEPALDPQRPCWPPRAQRGARGWSTAQGRVRAPDANPRDPTTVIPVCSFERPEPALGGRTPPRLGATTTLEYDAVKHIYGCSTRVVRELEIPEDWQRPTAANTERRSPQKLEEGVALGDETFQIRGFVLFGRPASARAEKGLEVAAWHRALAPERWLLLARPLGRFSLAQAEYYYDHDGSEPAAEWLWNMKWRARLVRFSWPERQRAVKASSNELAGLAGTAPFELDLERVRPSEGASLRDVADLVVH